MKRKLHFSLSLVLLLIVILSHAQTDFTATYTFGSNGNVASFTYNGTTYDGITFGNLEKVGVTSSSSTNNFRANNWPIGATNGTNDFTGEVDLGKYLGFSVSPVAGYKISIDTIIFGVGRSATGIRQSQWRGSSDNYAAPINNYAVLATNLTNNNGILTNPDENSSWIGNKLTPGNSYDDLTSPAGFRFYLFNSEATAGTGGFQGVLTIKGTFVIAGGNIPPSITGITKTPATDITSTMEVNIGATINDSDGTISAGQVKWGIATGTYPNTIPMVLAGKGLYATTAAIPAQVDGTTVYFVVEATDNQSSTTTSPEQTYIVSDPATSSLPYSETFNINLGDTYNYTVAGNKPWYFFNASATVNGFAGLNPEEHWLILPGMNFNNYSNEVLTFTTYAQYGTVDANNYLKLFYSTDYTGIGDVALSTWTELAFAIPAGIGATEVSSPSGNIDLSAITGANIHLAFKYLSTTSPTRFRIDDISVQSQVDVVENPASFTAIANGSDKIDLTFAPNLNSDNVVLVYNATGTFTDPSGVPPAVGQVFAGGTLLYNGTSSPQSHIGLSASETVYYKAFSYSGSAYSSGLTANATTEAGGGGGSNLTAGDIAFVAYATVAPDRFAFITFVDINANTEITFTDNGWKADNTWRATENTGTWTAPAGGIAAGSVIQIEGTTVAGGGAMSTPLDNLSSSGDQIIAYQGNASSPDFVTAINMHWTVWQADATNSNTSAIPSGLTNNINANAVALENGYYNGPTSGSINFLRSAINNPDNWVTNNSNQTWPTWTFIIGEGGNIPPSITNVAQNPTNNITPTSTVSVTADVTDSDGTITSVVLKWGLTTGNLTNTIPMGAPGKASYGTTTSIPAQGDGSTVYYAITATDNQAGQTTSQEFSYGVYAPATKLAFVGFPATGQQGVSLASFTVQAQRDDNSLDANFNGTITLSKASGAGNVSGTLAKSAVNGVATFTDIQFDQIGAYTLYADAAGLSQSISSQVNITDAPLLTEVLLPQYMQGVNSPNNLRLPFAFRVTLSNLNPSSTYRYTNQIVVASDFATTAAGAGNVLFVNSNNSFTYTSSPSLATLGGYGEFITDANGSFTGWFMNEPSGNGRFTPGNEVFMRIRLNDGNNGTDPVSLLTTTSPVKVINFGTELNANQGTAIRAESGAQAKNFIFLYDNILGNGRPLYGTSIETTGINYEASTSWAAFYIEHVSGEDGAWGGIIPNVNASGVRLLQERKLSDGTVASSRTSSDGVWGSQTTVNPTGGTTTVIVLDLNQAPSLAVNPTTLTGFTYNDGQGPSTTQSFVASGSNLLGSVAIVAAPSFEISLTNSPNFVAQDQINLNASGGILNNTPLFVRLKAGLAAGSYNEEPVYVASNGAETRIVSVSGNVVAGITEPVSHVTLFAASPLDFSKIQLNWTDAVPAASNYLIKGSSVSFDAINAPLDGIAEANAALVRNVASGAQTYTFDGLNSSTAYYFKIFPYNGTGNEVNYKTNGTVPQASASTPSGPTMTEDVLPLTMVGSPNRLPFAFRVTLSGLTPNITYKYINQAVDNGDVATTSGAGNSIYVSASGEFIRTTGAGFTNPAQHGEFTTDATGSYSGWFMLEPTANPRFTAGNTVYMRIRLNNGAGGITPAIFFTSQAVEVISFGTEANENQGTAIRATSAFLPGNFAFLYTSDLRTGRPVAGTSVESTGIDFSAVTSYPSYFRSLVAGSNGAWGTIIPNVLPSGITFIEERSNATGAVVSTKTSNNGVWGTTNTVNPTGGLENVLVLDLDVRPTIVVNTASLAGFDYFIGTGPSAEQTFIVNGTNLTSDIIVNAAPSYELSLGSGAQFVAQTQINLTQTEGVAGPVTLYVRMKAGLTGGNYNENIELSSTGAISKSVALTGVVSTPASEPVNHLTGFQATATGMTSIQLSWTDALPSVTGYLIKGSDAGFNAISAPVDGIVETESTLVKYVAAGLQTATFAGLNSETRYYFKAYAYNGNGLATNYKTNGNVPQDDVLTQGTPGLTNLIVPKYIQGENGTNNNRVPYAFRAQLKNLAPNTTYRYINLAVNAADGPTGSGAGIPIFIQNNEFIRSSNPGFATAGNYGELTTDADGYFDGWFMLETTGNSRFTPGQEVWMRIRLNNGMGGTSAVYNFTTEAITVINFGTTNDATSGTGIRATSNASPKNFVFIYDNPNGDGRPVYGTSVETTGIDFDSNTSYASFYRDNVADVIGSWGGIVPNANILGVRRVEERSLATGNIVDAKVSDNGFWGLTNTVNPSGGLDNILVLDLAGMSATEKIAGQLKYFNADETVMPTPTQQSVFYVQLMENGVAVRPRQLVKYNQTLDLDSYFEFANVEAGRTYSLKVWEQTQDNKLDNTWTWNNWGGVTALDALILSYMIAENPIVEQLPWIAPTGVPNFSTHFYNVADANNSGNLSAVDPLVLQNRMINEPGFSPIPGGRHNFQVAGTTVASHTTKKFPQAPETIFTPNGVYDPASAADQVYYEAVLPATAAGLNVFNVYFTATGDLNASFIPGAALQSSVETVTTEVVKTEVGAFVSIPVYAGESIEVAAMSLELKYQTEIIEVQSVEVDGLVNITDGKILVSWYNQQAKTFAAGEVIALVNAVVKADLNSAKALITIGQQTELADKLAKSISNVQLKTPSYTTLLDPEGELTVSSLVFPNPFNGYAKMQILLPEGGKCSVVIYNKLGQEVVKRESITSDKTMTIELNSELLHQSGLYFYHVIHQTATKSYQAKGNFVVIE